MTLSDKFMDVPRAPVAWFCNDRRGFYAAFGKRALDLTFVTLILPVSLVVIGAMILGPLLRSRECFVLQTRIGQYGKRFRTVQIDRECCFGLAQLPMLWNVFCGQMSLIGPSPMTPDGAAAYRGAAYFHLRPGMIDPAIMARRAMPDAADAGRGSAEYLLKQGLFYDLFTIWRYCMSR